MPVLINFKICDNAPECGGIEACKTGALSWDNNTKTIKIDNDKCINCGLCEKSCPVSAIQVARNENEYRKKEKEIEDDPREIADLYLDRYGAQPILPVFLAEKEDFVIEKKSNMLTAIELFSSDSIMCMLRSIPIKELFRGIEIKYRKIEADTELTKQLKISELPALIFFKDGQELGRVEGYFENNQLKTIKDKIDKILEKNG